MNQYYVMYNGAAWFVKEAEFFKSQGTPQTINKFQSSLGPHGPGVA